MRIRYLTCLFCLIQMATVSAQSDQLVTGLTLLVGQARSEHPDATSQLLDAGVVIPMPDQLLDQTTSPTALRLPQDVPGKLKKTLALKSAQIRRSLLAEQRTGEITELLMSESGERVGASVELLNLSKGTATFRVLFRNKDSVLNDSRVAVELGKRAVVGALQGEPGRFLFLVVNPLSLDRLPTHPEKPILLEMVLPIYSPNAVSARLQGRVKVSGTIGANGQPSALEILETPAEGLSTSALDAIRQWRYRAASDSGGKPRTVQLTWTLAFVLE